MTEEMLWTLALVGYLIYLLHRKTLKPRVTAGERMIETLREAKAQRHAGYLRGKAVIAQIGLDPAQLLFLEVAIWDDFDHGVCKALIEARRESVK